MARGAESPFAISSRLMASTTSRSNCKWTEITIYVVFWASHTNWTLMASDFYWAGTVTVPDFDRSRTIVNDALVHVTRHSRDAGVSAVAFGRGLESPVLDFANAPTKLFVGTAGQGVVVLRN